MSNIVINRNIKKIEFRNKQLETVPWQIELVVMAYGFRTIQNIYKCIAN